MKYRLMVAVAYVGLFGALAKALRTVVWGS